jgi:hypothetical protein
MKTFSFVSAALLSFCATQAQAQSSIGFQDIEVSYGYKSLDGTTQQSLDGAMDVLITGAHGLQLDLGSVKYQTSSFGHVAAHLYLAPGEYSKYGLFGSYADLNDNSGSNVTIGLEGLWSFGEAVTLEARAGMGVLSPDSYDYIFAEGTAFISLSESVELKAQVSWSDLEEELLSAQLIEATAGATYYFDRLPVEVFGGLSQTYLDQPSNTQNDTALLAKVTLKLGKSRSAQRGVKQRFFTTSRPLDVILNQGLIDF